MFKVIGCLNSKSTSARLRLRTVERIIQAGLINGKKEANQFNFLTGWWLFWSLLLFRNNPDWVNIAASTCPCLFVTPIIIAQSVLKFLWRCSTSSCRRFLYPLNFGKELEFSHMITGSFACVLQMIVKASPLLWWDRDWFRWDKFY